MVTEIKYILEMNKDKQKVIIRKYLTEDYKFRDTPSFIRYEHTGLNKDFMILLNEYSDDYKFLSIPIIDTILNAIEDIWEYLGDFPTIKEYSEKVYNEIHDYRDEQFEIQLNDAMKRMKK